MTSRTRLWVLLISTPVIVFAIIGGYLGQVMAKDETYQHLRVFEDVVSLVLNNYVEEVDIKKAMKGAMNGLADNLDADSGFLPANIVSAYEANQPAGPADVGVELSRQYYLRVISVRDGSAAAKAGIIAFTKTMAREMARSGVTLNAVCPGPTETPLLAGFLEGAQGQKIYEGLKRAIPLGRLGQPDDIPGIVAFLASDDAGFITGQVISVSGGLTMNG